MSYFYDLYGKTYVCERARFVDFVIRFRGKNFLFSLFLRNEFIITKWWGC